MLLEMVKKDTYTSLLVLDSPRNSDSGGIHLTGRRAFHKGKRKAIKLKKACIKYR